MPRESPSKKYVAATDYGTRKSTLNQQHVRFGAYKGTIYRRGDLQSTNWFLRVRLNGEKTYYRKSLDTSDRREAIERAQAELIAVLARVQSGERLVSLSLRDLLKKFAIHLDEQVKLKQIAQATLANYNSRIKLGCDFLRTRYPTGVNVKLSGIDGSVFQSYLPWRTDLAQRRKRTVRRDVVRDELLIIRKMFLWGKKQRMCTDKSLPQWDFEVEREGPKRRRINFQNFRDFINTTMAWAREAEGLHDIYQRRGLLYLISTAALSGMRSGEIFGLRNRDMERRGDDYLVSIRAETSKVRRARQIVISGNVLSKWIEKFQIHKAPSCYVFSPFDDGTTPFRNVFYHLYGLLRERLKDIELDWFDLYHCRHWYITNQLYAEQPIHLVAKAAGTSVKEIENTYSNVLTELTTKKFSERKVTWDPDGSYKIVNQVTRG